MLEKNEIGELFRKPDALRRNRSRQALAARILKKMGPEAVPVLVKALCETGNAYAADALKEIGGTAVPDLLRALAGPGAVHVAAVLKELGPTCVDELICEFGGESAPYASGILREMGSTALEQLIEAVQNGDSKVRVWAAITLREMGSETVDAVPVMDTAESDVGNAVKQSIRHAFEKTQLP